MLLIFVSMFFVFHNNNFRYNFRNKASRFSVLTMLASMQDIETLEKEPPIEGQVNLRAHVWNLDTHWPFV